MSVSAESLCVVKFPFCILHCYHKVNCIGFLIMMLMITAVEPGYVNC